MTEDRYIFVAKFAYGRANLAKVKVEKETEKAFTVTKELENLLGRTYLPGRLLKGKYFCFDTANDALLYLKEYADKYVAGCKNALMKAEEQARHLEAIRIVE